VTTICAWCATELSTSTGNDASASCEVSHGICDACIDRFFRFDDASVETFLNHLQAPVLLVTANLEVVSANDRALELIGKDRVQIRGHLGGDAIECAHAKLPGGCGRTMHCKACVVRNSVTETHATGRALKDVPAHMDIDRAQTTQKVRFLISTEKVEEVVLLRIEEAPA
jgi:PAS domain-containing protein